MRISLFSEIFEPFLDRNASNFEKDDFLKSQHFLNLKPYHIGASILFMQHQGKKSNNYFSLFRNSNLLIHVSTTRLRPTYIVPLCCYPAYERKNKSFLHMNHPCMAQNSVCICPLDYNMGAAAV